MVAKASKPKPKPKKSRSLRGGRYPMVVELAPVDIERLDNLVSRYRQVSESSNRVFVIRQLIRHAADGEKLPALKLT